MSNEDIYEKAVAKLVEKYGELAERDLIAAVELFDRLLERGKNIEPDRLKALCEKAGYDEFGSDELSKIYDIVDKYRQYKRGKEIRHWTDEMIDDLFQ